MWCAAHALFYFKLHKEPQDSFLVHENVYLIHAESSAEAMKKAEAVARANEDLALDGHLELNEMKASYVYVGIRKLIEVEGSADLDGVPADVLDGREVTYSVLEVDTLDEVMALAKGEMVEVLYRE